MMITIIILNAISATGFPLGKLLLQTLSPYQLVASRLIISSIILGIMYYFSSAKKISINDMKLVFNYGFWALFVSMAIGAWALMYIDSAKASFYYNLTPFITAFYSYIYFDERLTFKKWIGLILGFIGFAPFCATGPCLFDISLPDIGTLIAVVSFCYGLIVIRQLTYERSCSPITINMIGMLIGGFISLCASVAFGHYDYVTVWNERTILLLLGLVAGGVIQFNLYGYLLRTYTATFLSFAGFSGSLFSAFYGWLFLQEQITWAYAFCGILVLMGLAIFYYEELKQGYVKSNG